MEISDRRLTAMLMSVPHRSQYTRAMSPAETAALFGGDEDATYVRERITES
jgi:hypothetical protein